MTWQRHVYMAWEAATVTCCTNWSVTTLAKLATFAGRCREAASNRDVDVRRPSVVAALAPSDGPWTDGYVVCLIDSTVHPYSCYSKKIGPAVTSHVCVATARYADSSTSPLCDDLILWPGRPLSITLPCTVHRTRQDQHVHSYRPHMHTASHHISIRCVRAGAGTDTYVPGFGRRR